MPSNCISEAIAAEAAPTFDSELNQLRVSAYHS